MSRPNVNYRSPVKQHGVALITVMLIVALATIIAAQMTARLQVEVQRTANIEFNQQAYWYAMGAEAFSKQVLTESFKESKNKTYLGQVWAQGETTYPVENGQITGEITDLQACFNLNSLRANPASTSGASTPPPTKAPTASSTAQPKKVLINLIEKLGIEGIGRFEAEYMADALSDWLDQDSSIASAGGAEDNDYASKEFPYLAANNYLASVNELRVIEHFTVPVINALKPYVCVLPNNNLDKINVNTLTDKQDKLLSALLDISNSDAQSLIADRDEEGYANITDFLASQTLAKAKITDPQKKQLTVKSQYFNLKTTTSFNNSFFTMNAILHVTGNNQIEVISRRIGRE